MAPLIEVRHSFMGSTLSEADCYARDCRTKINLPKILHREFHGYGEDARDLTHEEEEKIRKAAAENLKQHPSHEVHIFFGHKENVIEPETGVSKTLYEYSPDGKHIELSRTNKLQPKK